MSQDNVEIVRRMFDSWARGDFRAGSDDLDPHVTFVVRSPFPESGVVHGPEGVRKYMYGFLEQFDQLAIEAEKFRAAGDTVVVQARQHGTGRSSGAPADVRYFQLFTFRAGKVVRIESILDEDEALEAAGLPE
jgi:ketosteroid isomerase-like protein